MHDGLKKTMVALAIVSMGALAVTLDAQQEQGRGAGAARVVREAVAGIHVPSA